MKERGAKAGRWVLASALAIGAALALPVGGQETPQQLLPDTPEAPPPPAAAQSDTSGAATAVVSTDVAAPDASASGAGAHELDSAFAAKPASGRDIGVAGPLTSSVSGPGGGYGLQTFAGSNGRYLYALMRRMQAPVASRWAHITLRRALLSESAAPAGINPADWIAGRAWLLMRMGEIDGAKALIDAVPVDRYSPALYRVAAQTAFAAADLGALCPLAVTGSALSRDPVWPLSVAICGAMQGDDLTAAQVFDELRKGDKVDGFDIRLGERVATLAGGGGRASNFDWNEAPVLTPYRWGVATAAGLQVPADKLQALGAARYGWLVRAAPVASGIRQAALGPAAAIGIMSGDELVSAVSAAAAGQGDDAIAGTPAGRLRQAMAAGSGADRLTALRAIWSAGDDERSRYAALIESAPAALRMSPNAAAAGDAAQIVAALLSVGAESMARRWALVASDGSPAVKAQAWALLAVGSERGPAAERAEFDKWRSGAGPAATDHRAALLIAGLTGLGRTRGSGWDSLRSDLVPAAADNWSRAIETAAAAGRAGEVIILAGTALQGQWRDVPAAHLRDLVAALVRVGRGHEARMIAAEAVTRG